MSVLADFWTGIPKEVKAIIAISIFLFAGSTILQAIVFLWNLLAVNAINALNGCWSGTTSACIPEQDGIYIFGINFVDYWTIVVIIILVPVALFAIKWYGFIFGKVQQN